MGTLWCWKRKERSHEVTHSSNSGPEWWEYNARDWWTHKDGDGAEESSNYRNDDYVTDCPYDGASDDDLGLMFRTHRGCRWCRWSIRCIRCVYWYDDEHLEHGDVEGDEYVGATVRKNGAVVQMTRWSWRRCPAGRPSSCRKCCPPTTWTSTRTSEHYYLNSSASTATRVSIE